MSYIGDNGDIVEPDEAYDYALKSLEENEELRREFALQYPEFGFSGNESFDEVFAKIEGNEVLQQFLVEWFFSGGDWADDSYLDDDNNYMDEEYEGEIWSYNDDYDYPGWDEIRQARQDERGY